MDGEPPKRLETFKIVCTLYPEIFDIDKSICKNYFRQYGKVLRLIFKPKQRAIVVEYTNKNDYLNALAGSSEYEGQPFKMEAFESLARPPPPNDLPKKKSREKVVKRHKLAYISPKVTVRKPDVSYVDTEEVNDELAAMGAYSSVQALEIYDLTSDSSHLQALPPPPPPPPRVPKLNRVWKKSTQIVPESSVAKQKKSVVVKKKLVQTLAKRRLKEKSQMLTTEQLELLKVIKTQANTVEEKCRILDARDKLLRSINKKPRLKSNPTVGTCPDMCPEKERLRRELQHQISIFEQDDTSRHFMNHSKAVKQYSRSSADQEAPLPHELRPVHVLQFTMTYLMFNIMDLSETDQEVNIGEWFHFLWDRTRGIRKDITQQALCCHGSVELVEQCARFHIHCSARLMGEDPSVFDQKINTENLTKCLQTLKYMYHDLKLKGEECPNEPEFRAYIILLNLSDGNFMWEVQELSRDIQKSREVKFALQIYSAFEKRNYVRFFKLIKSTTYLNACILMRYFLQVRVQAIESLIKCFTPIKSISFYPTKELTNLLFFDYEEATVDFMKTYGLGLNKDGTHLMIERISFSIPEYPYVMERSHCVERKRTLSVGATVNGHELSPEMYMEIQSHVVHDSFDKDGCLVQDEMFNEIERTIEERLLDEPDSSRESTPERKSMVTNIFAAAKHPSQSTSKHTSSPSKAPKEDKNIFSQPNEDVFGQRKHESGNIFVLKSSNVFGQSRTDEGNIFGQIQTDQVKPTGNIFAMTCEKGIDQVDNIKQKENIFIDFGNKEIRDVPNIFSRKPTESEKVDGFEPIEVKEDNTFPTEHKTPTISANRDPRTQKSFVFGPSAPATTEAEQNIFASVKPEESKKGGFFFVLNRPSKPTEVPNIFATGFSQSAEMEEEKLRDEAELEALEEERHKLQEEIKKEIAREEDEEMRKQEEVRQRIEEMRRRNEEAAERRRLEAERTRMEEIKRKRLIEEERLEKERRLEEERIDRLKLLEEERLRQENERIKLEKERKRRDEELEREKRDENERRTLLEIERTVKLVIADLIENVDTTLRQANLKRIRSTIQRRALMKICKKWRNFTVTRMRKRKALDCNPVFVYTKSITQCAKDLQSKSQDSTLLYMKRYKYGKPLDVPLSEEPSMMKLNLFHLTYSSLRRRLCELKEKWHQHIYWKVVFSIPDIDEMLNGLHTLEETLKSYIGWELDKYGNTVYIEQHKTVTYCMEKQQGFDVTNNDANAFVFIAKSFNDVMQQRIFQNLKDFGVYVKLPVVLILEDTTNADEYLNNLLETGIVSDYVIYSCGLNSVVLPSIIDNALIFSSKHVEKYPPLELDTLYSFLMKNLCTEMWKKASSYARWNHEYNFCMRDPNIVINLYNEGLDILTKIAISDKCKEHSTFPAIFLNYLPDKIPDALPCDYRYFPQFWATSNYQRNLRETMDALHLPKFMEKWPPENDNDLIVSVSKYCTEVFKYPKEPLIAVLNTFRDYAEDLDFDRIIWTEAVQVLAEEKLKESDLKLPKIFNSDVYNTLVVVYDRFDLQEYNSSEWFYRNNPTIEGFKKVVSEKVEEEKDEIKLQTQQKRKRALEYSMDGDDVLEVIDKAEKILKSSNSVCLNTKDQIDHLNRSLRDLEDSINVVKRMDQMNLLRRFIDN